MRSRKLYLVLIAILLVFFVVVFLIFGAGNFIKKNHQATIIVGNATVWKYENKKWYSISNTESLQKLDWQQYEVFVDNKRFGDYYLWKDDQWYLFDSKNNGINYTGKLIAYEANYDLSITSFEEDDNMDQSLISSILVERNISPDQNLTSASHVAFDFDSDGVLEDFYLITNAFDMEKEVDVNFSIVFMVKNNETYLLYDSVHSGSNYNACKPFFNSFLDVDQDKNYELLLSCGRYSVEDQLDMLYQYVDGEFKIVISNQ